MILILMIAPLTWMWQGHSTQVVASAPSVVYLPLIISTQPPPIVAAAPSWGAPIAVSPLDESIWTVNPDADTVSVIDAASASVQAEISVGREPWALAIAPDGQQVYVLNRASGSLSVIDSTTNQVQATLPLGPEPGTLALSPTGRNAYVSLTAADAVAVVDTARLTITQQIAVDPHPYAVAVTNDGDSQDSDEQVYVTHLTALPRPGGAEARDDGREGRITVIDAAAGQVATVISLPPDEHGFPNMLAGIALAGPRAWVPHGRAAPDLPNELTTTVFAAVSSLDLSANVEDRAAHLPLNDQDIFASPVNNPVAAVPSPDGSTLYVVLAGSNLVEVVDVSDPTTPRLVNFLPTGDNPRGMTVSRDGSTGYVLDYLGRSVTVLDLERLERIATIPVTGETLDPEILRGKILFHNASNPRISGQSWVSCASCHGDGGTDSVTWFFPDGPRQTPPLWNSAQTGPFHWSAALDELHDVEDTIHIQQHGLGLAPGADPPLLGPPNAGRSADLDALAAFMAQGIRVPAVPQPPTDLARGRALFVAAGCASCHGGPHWTTSAMPGSAGTLDPDGNGMVDEVLRDVGTVNPRDLRGATGFDVPSLLGVGLTPPYLHDGSYWTLEALLASGHPDPEGDGNGLTAEEIRDLSAFVRSIGPDTEPVQLEERE
jgi:YVTN family beta-propeller protein